MDLNKLHQWCNERGWIINLKGRSHTSCHEDKIISISWQTKGYKQLYTILHECGHIIIRENVLTFVSEYPSTFKFYSQPNKNNEHGFKIDIIREEVRAWDLGIEIAQELDIKIDNILYRKLANQCLRSYIKWSQNKLTYDKQF